MHPMPTTKTSTPMLSETVTLILGARDQDGDLLTYQLESTPFGTLTPWGDGSDGEYSYTPALDAGQDDTDAFTFSVNDGELDSNVATVTITIGNQPPEADNITRRINR